MRPKKNPNAFKAKWAKFDHMFIAPNVPAAQRQEIRSVFYGGALAAMEIIIDAGHSMKSLDDLINAIENVGEELAEEVNKSKAMTLDPKAPKH